MNKQKHIPLRKCIACGEMKPKAELFRIYLTDGKAGVDQTFKAGGRGAYICRSSECIERAIKTKRIERVVGDCSEAFYKEIRAEASDER